MNTSSSLRPNGSAEAASVTSNEAQQSELPESANATNGAHQDAGHASSSVVVSLCTDENPMLLPSPFLLLRRAPVKKAAYLRRKSLAS